ncbi:MAG: DNA internalization-related competence protein ComEC/Rec2 [Vicinamibacterales bacterium]
MRSVALVPSLAILCGAYVGTAWGRDLPGAVTLVACLWSAGVMAWARQRSIVALVALTAGYALAAATLGAASARDALAPSSRTVLDAAYGGFSLDEPGPPGLVEPVRMRARLVEDAAHRDFGTSLRVHVEAMFLDDEWRRAEGGVRLTVSGAAAARHVASWRAGRLLEAPVTFRRPGRYLNDRVPDLERNLALDGVALTGGIKSALLVEVVEAGSRFEEAAADLRAHVRAVVQRRVGTRDPVAAAIVTAILIGDRTALPDDVRARLQAAGTYHVIAISGGNIAILAALMAGGLTLVGVRGRVSALAIICGLTAYAGIVSAGPSVWRATATAIVYFAARLLDHRSPPWNAMAVSAALLACAAPLDVRDVGFALTFGATAAILEAAHRVRGPRSAVATWALASVVASCATEIVLLPISATAFSRVTVAGLALNLLAVPLMTVTQIAGLAVVCLDGVEPAARLAGRVAAAGARGLVESARLVDVLPWLALRVPPPPALVVVCYYVALAGAVWMPRARPGSILVLASCGVVVLTGAAAALRAEDLRGRVRLTLFDVGQGDALLLQTAGGRALMIDAGGAGIDGAAFDIGGRVLAPALWARGVVRIEALAVTHGDPDHIGGAVAIVRDFRPAEIWEGIPMPHHPPVRALMSAAAASGGAFRSRLAGWRTAMDGAHIRVLHPPPPDWERPRVRNDDSMVLEVRYGDVVFLLTGDIGAEVEQSLLRSLSPARIRILKAAHHGSRTSTSQALVDAWRPQIALISCGRGNRFGHPVPEVLRRLEAAGTRIYRTDRDGQITVETDGRGAVVRTYLGATKNTKP